MWGTYDAVCCRVDDQSAVDYVYIESVNCALDSFVSQGTFILSYSSCSCPDALGIQIGKIGASVVACLLYFIRCSGGVYESRHMLECNLFADNQLRRGGGGNHWGFP